MTHFGLSTSIGILLKKTPIDARAGASGQGPRASPRKGFPARVGTCSPLHFQPWDSYRQYWFWSPHVSKNPKISARNTSLPNLLLCTVSLKRNSFLLRKTTTCKLQTCFFFSGTNSDTYLQFQDQGCSST